MDPINYIFKGARLGGFTKSGLYNDTFDINSSDDTNIPEGYKLANANNNFTYGINSPHNIDITVDPAQIASLNVNYVNQAGTHLNNDQTISNYALANYGAEGTRHDIKPSLHVPDGYNYDPKYSNQTIITIPRAGTRPTLTIHVLGDPVTYHPYVNVRRDNLPEANNTVTMSGRVGDTVTADPNVEPQLLGNGGYTLDLKGSQYLTNNKISAVLNPSDWSNKITWSDNNQRPVIHYQADREYAHVYFINQNGTFFNNHGSSDLNGFMNQNSIFASDGNVHGFQLPNGYHYDIKHLNNITQYQFSNDRNQNFNVYIKGNKAQMTVNYLDGHNNTLRTCVLNGDVGDTADFTKYLPNGYSLAKGSVKSADYDVANKTYNVHVNGNHADYKANITVRRDGMPDKIVSVDFSGNIGDTVTVNANIMPTNGYKFDANSNGLVNGKLQAVLTSNGLQWPDGQVPVVHYSAAPKPNKGSNNKTVTPINNNKEATVFYSEAKDISGNNNSNSSATNNNPKPNNAVVHHARHFNVKPVPVVSGHEHYGSFHMDHIRSHRSHYKYFRVTRANVIHTRAHFTRRNARGVLMPRMGLTIPIKRVFKIHTHGYVTTRFEIRINHHNYYVSGNHHYVQNSYLQPHNFRHHSMMVKLIRPAYIYSSRIYYIKNRIQLVRPGSVVRIKGITFIGRHSHKKTRLYLGHGHWITANRNFVKVI